MVTSLSLFPILKIWLTARVGCSSIAIIAFMGPLANIILAIVFTALIPVIGGALIVKAVQVNVYLAVLGMLPLPSLNGGQVFFGSRLLYIFTAAFVLGVALMLKYLPIVATVIGALVFAAIVFGVIYYEYELK